MENRKIYARQIPPEYQESPLFFRWDEETHPGLVVTGNRDYNSHTVPVWDKWAENWEEAADELDKLKDRGGNPWYKNATEAIMDLLPPEHKERYTTQEIHRWKSILADMQTCRSSEEYRPALAALELMTGHKWDTCTIRGSSQGYWQNVYYDTTLWSREALNNLEIEYFNEGAEWIVHDEEEPPECPEDVQGYSVYTHAWNDDGIRREIADAAGGDPKDVILYTFTGWTRSACYEEATA